MSQNAHSGKKSSRKNSGEAGKKYNKWKNIYYVEFYVMSSQGAGIKEICARLNLVYETVRLWIKKRATLRKAIERGKEVFDNVDRADEKEGAFQNFVFQRLPENLRELWRKIRSVSEEPNGVKRMEALLQEGGKYARMHLWLYALSCYNFSITKACKAVNIPRTTVKFWIATEAGFGQLIQEMHEAKKDFFQEHLVKAVKRGETSAIIFANKTINRDIGYGEETTVKHVGEVSHVHTNLNLDQLAGYVSEECMIELLEGVRKLRRKQEIKAIDYRGATGHNAPSDEELLKDTIGKDEDVVDAEFEPKEKEKDDDGDDDE